MPNTHDAHMEAAMTMYRRFIELAHAVQALRDEATRYTEEHIGEFDPELDEMAMLAITGVRFLPLGGDERYCL